jgi:hypothetical protein
MVGENYISCLWSEGYNTIENFLIELPATNEYLKKIKCDMYVGRPDRKNVMIIKSVLRQGTSLIVSGKQLLRALNDVAFIGTIEEGSNIDMSLFNAYNGSTKVNNVVFSKSGLSDTYKHQISNKLIDELALTMCQSEDVGIRCFKDGSSISVETYKPQNTPVKFSKFIGNAVFDNVTKSTENFKNCAIVLGQGEGENRTKVVVDLSKGKQKRELIVDARDIGQEEGESLGAYEKRLYSRGFEKLLEQTEVFSIDITGLPVGFGKNFDLGYKAEVIIPEYDLVYSTRITKFEEKAQKNNSEIKITFGELIEKR